MKRNRGSRVAIGWLYKVDKVDDEKKGVIIFSAWGHYE